VTAFAVSVVGFAVTGRGGVVTGGRGVGLIFGGGLTRSGVGLFRRGGMITGGGGGVLCGGAMAGIGMGIFLRGVMTGGGGGVLFGGAMAGIGMGIFLRGVLTGGGMGVFFGGVMAGSGMGIFRGGVMTGRAVVIVSGATMAGGVIVALRRCGVIVGSWGMRVFGRLLGLYASRLLIVAGGRFRGFLVVCRNLMVRFAAVIGGRLRGMLGHGLRGLRGVVGFEQVQDITGQPEQGQDTYGAQDDAFGGKHWETFAVFLRAFVRLRIFHDDSWTLRR
jgi:hypothetical protein